MYAVENLRSWFYCRVCTVPVLGFRLLSVIILFWGLLYHQCVCELKCWVRAFTEPLTECKSLKWQSKYIDKCEVHYENQAHIACSWKWVFLLYILQHEIASLTRQKWLRCRISDNDSQCLSSTYSANKASVVKIFIWKIPGYSTN